MAAPANMHNLTTLIKRLEAATSRLEDIATSTDLAADDLPMLHRSTTSAIHETPTGDPLSGSKEPLPEFIEEYDAILESSVNDYIRLSKELGGVVAQQAAEVLTGFQEQRKFLLMTAKATKPDPAVCLQLLMPINDVLISVTELKESNRSDPMLSHLSAVADGIMMLAWVTIENRPYKHVDECLGSAQFFGNRLLRERKEDPKQVEWINSFYRIFRDLSTYVRQYFSTGVSWNSQGEPALEVLETISEPAFGSSGATHPPPPPPPPPGPPPLLEVKKEQSSAASTGGFDAVFSELNQGAAITKSLRKVDKSEMTHKNPSLRAGSLIGDKESIRAKSPAPGKKPKPQSMRAKKPPKKELDGNKWTIENYDGESQPLQIEAAIAHSVLVSRCNNTTIIIKGKANQVTIENSARLSLVVDSLVSTVDVVKAQNLALQVLGTIPTVLLDQVDGAVIYLSKESTGTKLFTSKSDGVNLNIISGPDEDFKEVPLPSQICSHYDADKCELVHEIVAYAG
ncbi:hypothetical protein L249_5421 [Ophiocordyceps polyrhachis-furcata BCC 54312]|uniref:Adenylyl cyclase-associated protein n=1 Tax=Ophiocordyceps polyrhachis-furcata BCC 54312 TaxID=1330021 RepID=A0A367L913_9HYPO|nr:hypothetical protein L249_5421 [Ophiocordyceps polyrhachis-furcata BCC 54312]